MATKAKPELAPMPKPPASMLTPGWCEFAPAHDLKAWVYSTFIKEDGALYNPDHEHLSKACVLFVWASQGFAHQGKEAVGVAGMGPQRGALGKKELLESVYRSMNGGILPDFVITLSAPFMHETAPSSACAVIEHELYHCAQARDEFGCPKFTRDGDPIWAIRAHDVEEFVGVVRRYGAHSADLMEMQAAFKQGPQIKPSEAANVVCGCGAKIAR